MLWGSGREVRGHLQSSLGLLRSLVLGLAIANSTIKTCGFAVWVGPLELGSGHSHSRHPPAPPTAPRAPDLRCFAHMGIWLLLASGIFWDPLGIQLRVLWLHIVVESILCAMGGLGGEA